MARKNIDDLRDSIFDTIEMLKSGKIDVDTANAVAGLTRVVVESAKVEADFIRAVGGRSVFISESEEHSAGTKVEYLTNGMVRRTLPDGTTRITAK